MEKKEYKYRSGITSNIAKLKDVVGVRNQAALLDLLIYKSVNSNFRIEDHPHPDRWITNFYEHTTKTMGYSRDYLTRLISKFNQLGLIERKKKISKNKCRSCIRVTDKALLLVGRVDLCGQLPKEAANNDDKDKDLPSKSNSTPAKKTGAYKEDKRSSVKLNNIIRPLRGNNVTCFQQEKNKKLYNLPPSIKQLFHDIGERMSESHKALLYGAICRTDLDHGTTLKFNTEFVAWAVFSFLESKHQYKNIKNCKHRINAIMKQAREGSFRKPIGFNTQWDIGIALREKRLLGEQRYENEKRAMTERRAPEPVSISPSLSTPARKQWEVERDLKEAKVLETQRGLALQEAGREYELFSEGKESLSEEEIRLIEKDFDEQSEILLDRFNEAIANVADLQVELARVSEYKNFSEQLPAIFEASI